VLQFPGAGGADSRFENRGSPGVLAGLFFGELIVAPIWSIPMDIAPRYAGFANGMMNFGFGVAGLVSPSSFGYLVNRTGNWAIPFYWVHCTIALRSGTRTASAAEQGL
jgi:hypothetical protein